MCAVTKTLREEVSGADVRVLSTNPRTAALLTGCRSALPFTPYHSLRSLRGIRATLAFLLRSRATGSRLALGLDGLVVGGGSVLNDRDSGNLAMWTRLVQLYKRLGARLYFYGTSVGPIRRTASLEVVRDIIMSAAGNTFRDAPSVALMQDLLPHDRLIQAADPVLSLIAPQMRPLETAPFRGELRIGFNVRRISSIPDAKIEQLGLTIAEALLRHFDATLLFLPMSADDLPLAMRLKAQLPPEVARRFAVGSYDHSQLAGHINVYQNLDVIVSMRLHTAILATLHNVPVLGLDCNAKIPGFLEQVGLGPFVVRVSDGLDSVDTDPAAVVTQLKRLIDSWPEIRLDSWNKLHHCRERERMNMVGLRRAFGIATRSSTQDL
jgi:polysaccharide pyruvyl transferase WcaK-like protein